MSNTYLVYILCTVLSFVPALVFHEAAHGFAAYKLGDPTAKRAGRLSLNPLKHVDPFGTVILPLCLLALGGPVFGYAKPVPYNPAYFKDPKRGDVVVGLAGPAANLALACVGAAAAWALYGAASGSPALLAGGSGQAVAVLLLQFLPTFVLINLYLMFFNLLPIPPLDGSSVFALLVPRRYLPQYYRVQRYAFPIFMVVLVLVPYLLHVNPVGIYLDATAGNVGNLLFPFRIS